MIVESALRTDVTRAVSSWVPPTPAASLRQQRFLALLSLPDDPTRRHNPGAHITASALVVSAELDHVLLTLHRRLNVWLQFGGHCEDGDETVAEAAFREATEESGITGLVLSPEPIDLDIHDVVCRYGPSTHFDIRYAAVAPPGAVEIVSPESHALGWFAPTHLPQPLGDAVTTLVGPALAAAAHLVPDRT